MFMMSSCWQERWMRSWYGDHEQNKEDDSIFVWIKDIPVSQLSDMVQSEGTLFMSNRVAQSVS
jgi:hypothetical protein